jgi:hypothetical protein
MFKSLSKYDIISLCAFALVMVLWMTGLTVAVVKDRATPVTDTIIVATPDEATPDEATPDEVEVTECTTAPEITEPTTVETSMPQLVDIKPVETKPATDKKHTSNKTETNKKPANSSTATADTPSKGKMSETEMLACVIYQEVGGNAHCDECRRRVADVVLNRVADDRFPNSIEKVLTAKNQYGRFHYTGIKWASSHTNPSERKAVERAWRIAEEVMAGKHSDLYGKGYVWQAGFKQGTSGFWCCGHYFAKGKA